VRGDTPPRNSDEGAPFVRGGVTGAAFEQQRLAQGAGEGALAAPCGVTR
jgi:hypothetical protein